MAYIVMAHIVVAHIVMAHTVMTHTVVADIVTMPYAASYTLVLHVARRMVCRTVGGISVCAMTPRNGAADCLWHVCRHVRRHACKCVGTRVRGQPCSRTRCRVREKVRTARSTSHGMAHSPYMRFSLLLLYCCCYCCVSHGMARSTEWLPECLPEF